MIKGVDVSHWQSGFDFVKGVKDGIQFMMTKASEGLGVDSTCPSEVQKARNAGIKFCGAYHFFHANKPISLQVSTYKNEVASLKLEMPPILDLEETSVNGMSLHDVAGTALQWLSQAESVFGRVPLLYIDMNMINQLGVSKDVRFRKYPLWIARYNPNQPPMHWEFWQFTDKGEQGADTNYFSGSIDDLSAFCKV